MFSVSKMKMLTTFLFVHDKDLEKLKAENEENVQI